MALATVMISHTACSNDADEELYRESEIRLECTSLSTVHVEPTTPPALGSNAFQYCMSDINIYVPAQSLELYKAAAGWKDLNISAGN